jgi:hypothetical protein
MFPSEVRLVLILISLLDALHGNIFIDVCSVFCSSVCNDFVLDEWKLMEFDIYV